MKISPKLKRFLQKIIHKTKLDKEQIYFALTLIAGITAGIVASGIRYIVHEAHVFFGTLELDNLRSISIGALLVLVSAYTTWKIAPNTASSGIPRLKIIMAVHHGRIVIKEWLAKLFTSITSLASGLSVGMEGPTVNICAGIASTLGQIFSLPKRRLKNICAVGAAGGIAAAFNTPIAAVVFTLEEIVGDLNAKMLGAIVITAVASAVTGGLILGTEPLFPTVTHNIDDPRELITYFLVGVVCSIAGPVIVKALVSLREIYKNLFDQNIMITASIAFIGVLFLFQFHSLVPGSGHDASIAVLTGDISGHNELFYLFVLKTFALILCFASGISGGLFMPTLCLGSILGGLVGSIAHLYLSDIYTNIPYAALVGMGALFAAIIRAPFTSIIMIFEMTQDYNIILPLMIANITAYTISGKLQHLSVYEVLSEQDGVHLPSRDDYELLENFIVEDIMVDDVVTFECRERVQDCYEKIKMTTLTGFPVTSNKKLFGIISKVDLNICLAKEHGDYPVSQVCNQQVISIYPDQTLMVAFHLLKKYHVSRLPVISRIRDQVVGIITIEDIVGHFGYQVAKNRSKEAIPANS